jgi:imidazolonepropionase-like amidohydrolase
VTLFENVRVLDGRSAVVSAPSNVLVKGGRIARISTPTIVVDGTERATVIVGGGHGLMPGLIDAHCYTMLVPSTPTAAIMGGVGFINLMAGAEATRTLMRGFTTMRDLGGPVWDLKQAIDMGVVAGPRIFPSGAMITVTSGHGDFRMPFELPRTIGAPQSRMEQINGSLIADGPDEVRVREQFMLRASQIKLTAGGGVSSPHSPQDVSSFTEAELLALSGLRSPYTGKLGVVEEGALADLLLVDGNALENITLVENPAKNFVVIMKDSKVYKNLLAPRAP